MSTAADQRHSTTPLLGIVGPTASGKTDLALAIAHRLPVEIVVADSRQVYRGMDIGTAKPDAAARAAVSHHLLDLVEPDQQFTVAQWVERARRVVREIAARSRLPLLVGGTGLYVSSLIEGHDYGGQAWDPDLRRTLTAELEADGVASLAARLVALAPQLAARTDLRNPRRVVRALERAGGGGEAPRGEPYAGRVTLVGIARPREVLYRRIDNRAAWLFANGLLDEARVLLDAGFGPDLAPMSGHGYAEAMRHLAGEWSLEQAIEITARRTRQYAKRQLTWFRRQTTVTWIEAGDAPADAGPIVEEAQRLLRAGVT